jgi:ribosomal protein S18 acetylase RimI-like enzyme
MASRRLTPDRATPTVELASVDPAGMEAQECLGRYFAELAARFREGFELEKDAPPESAEYSAPSGCFLIARLNGETVGCGAFRTLKSGIGEIRRMWVAPQARGLGIARSILERLEREARLRGLRAVRLDTNSALTEALRLYRSAGYGEIARFNDNPYAHHWFEKVFK